MMGIKKPIPVFVVAPNIVITSPIFGIRIAIAKEIAVRMKVHRAFYLLLIFVFGGKKISSIVSLQGNKVSGVAKRITVRIPKRQI